MHIIEALQYYIRSELIIIIPVLFLIEKFLFKAHVNDTVIGVVVLLSSLFLTTLYTVTVCSANNWRQICTLIFSILTQGILLAGAHHYLPALKKGNLCRNEQSVPSCPTELPKP